MSDAQRRSILEAAARDPELRRQVPPVVAAGFGVLALRRLGDVLTVACFPNANRQALRVLRDVLAVEIVATPFDERLLHEAIREAYFSGEESLNYPTFRDPEFLSDPASAEALGAEKVERPGPVRNELPAGSLVLGDLTFRSVLENLDGPSRGGALPEPRRTRLELGDMERAWWRAEGGQLRAHRADGAIPDGAIGVFTEYRLCDYRHIRGGGRLSEHAVAAILLEELPLVVHPTEVQLTGVRCDGTLEFHVYDRTERCEPGAARRLELSYVFLSYGNRLRRRITLDVHELLLTRRADVEVVADAAPWGARAVARWFGLPDTMPARQE